MQPDVIVNLLHSNDYDGFCDRQLFVCPPEQDVDYDDIIAPPDGTPDLKDLFYEIDLNHASPNDHYTLSKDAHEEFVSFHDQLNERKRSQNRRDKDRKSILSKAKGQVARLAAVLFVIDQALDLVMHNTDVQQPWSFEIPQKFMQQAIHLIDFCIAQKFALGKPAFKPPPAPVSTDNVQPQQIDDHRVKRLLELPSPITVTHITQHHIQKRVDNKYRKEEAQALMEDVVQLKLGEIVPAEYQAGKQKREKNILLKRKIDELDEERKDILKRLKVDLEKFCQ